jgi:hypothetical protein
MLDECDAPWSPVFLAGLLEPAEVHQAAGMVMKQLEERSIDAIARLRGHAALIDRPVIDVAWAIIDRELWFE